MSQYVISIIHRNERHPLVAAFKAVRSNVMDAAATNLSSADTDDFAGGYTGKFNSKAVFKPGTDRSGLQVDNHLYHLVFSICHLFDSVINHKIVEVIVTNARP